MKPRLCLFLCLAFTVSSACRSSSDDTDDPTSRKTAKVPDAVAVADAAHGCSVSGECPPNALYPAKGLGSLVDGRMGTDDFEDVEWMGWWYEDKPFEVTIDLGKLVAIKELGIHTLTATEAWIFYPRKVEFAVSSDGKTFANVATVTPSKEDMDKDFPETLMLKASGLTAGGRYLRVRAERYGELPDWHAGHGGADGYEGQAWLFVDEIVVNPK